jgi:hypothetical protein
VIRSRAAAIAKRLPSGSVCPHLLQYIYHLSLVSCVAISSNISTEHRADKNARVIDGPGVLRPIFNS